MLSRHAAPNRHRPAASSRARCGDDLFNPVPPGGEFEGLLRACGKAVGHPSVGQTFEAADAGFRPS
jgi:hypothetical protein